MKLAPHTQTHRWIHIVDRFFWQKPRPVAAPAAPPYHQRFTAVSTIHRHPTLKPSPPPPTTSSATSAATSYCFTWLRQSRLLLKNCRPSYEHVYECPCRQSCDFWVSAASAVAHGHYVRLSCFLSRSRKAIGSCLRHAALDRAQGQRKKPETLKPP